MEQKYTKGNKCKMVKDNRKGKDCCKGKDCSEESKRVDKEEERP